jgi:hypothetical protein
MQSGRGAGSVARSRSPTTRGDSSSATREPHRLGQANRSSIAPLPEPLGRPSLCQCQHHKRHRRRSVPRAPSGRQDLDSRRQSTPQSPIPKLLSRGQDRTGRKMIQLLQDRGAYPIRPQEPDFGEDIIRQRDLASLLCRALRAAGSNLAPDLCNLSAASAFDSTSAILTERNCFPKLTREARVYCGGVISSIGSSGACSGIPGKEFTMATFVQL